MAYEICIYANTNLSVDEINDVLSKDLDIQVDEDYPDTIVGNGFYCYVSRFAADARYSPFLEKPVTLDITFRYHPAAKGNVDLMTFVINWLRYTDADTVLENNHENMTLMRVDGKIMKNINPQVLYYCGNLDLCEIPYDEADFGTWLVEDKVFVDCVHDTLQIMENYCRRLFDDQETRIVKRKTAHAIPETCARVEREAFQIDTFRYRPLMWPEKWKRAGNKYPFLPNHEVDIFYTKGRGIPLKKNGAYDVPIRDVTLKGLAGLIKSTDYSLVVEFSDPTRDVLIYHAGELTLFEDSCWTEERQSLFDGIPYRFCAPIP